MHAYAWMNTYSIKCTFKKTPVYSDVSCCSTQSCQMAIKYFFLKELMAPLFNSAMYYLSWQYT